MRKGALSKWHARYIREVTQMMKTTEYNYIYNGKKQQDEHITYIKL